MILFWVPGGMALMLDVEGAIAKALQSRGESVHAILCDGPFRACVRREIKDDLPVSRWAELCAQCRRDTSAGLDAMGVGYSYIGDHVPESVRAELWEKTQGISWERLEELQHEGVAIGNNARSAIIRYLQGCEVAGNEAVVREYAYSALVCAESSRNAFRRFAPKQIFMSHGVYADWGPALQTALHQGIPVAAWMASYLHGRFYFRHVEDAVRIDFHNVSDTAWSECRRSEFSSHREARLRQYLHNRYHRDVSFDMKRFKKYSGKALTLRRHYAPLPDKPVWGIMAHINWDCVSDYSPMAYASFDEWIIDTVTEISGITDVQWLLKVHPAESWDNPASGVQKLIERLFPRLPEHVRIIAAEEEISPLDFFQMIDGGVTVYGTAGLELLLQGKPVILAGEAHYGGKGFSHDGLTPQSYRQLLRKAHSLPLLDEEELLLAKKYAYCYFIERQVPFPVVYEPGSPWWRYQTRKAQLLLPGQDPFTDFICDRILDGRDFVMPEKLVELAETVYEAEQPMPEPYLEASTADRPSEVAALINQASQVMSTDPKLAKVIIERLLSDHGSQLQVAVRDELHHFLLLLEQSQSMPIATAPPSIDSGEAMPLLGFDPDGEVFTRDGRIFRGLFAGKGGRGSAILESCLKGDLFERGMVKTVRADAAPFAALGYDMVLEHERVPFISYAHEWTPTMLRDAALFQLELNAALLEQGLLLKDCGVTTNVLFDGPKPVQVDFLSVIAEGTLTAEAWLKPEAGDGYQGVSEKSQYFGEIFQRMFNPGLLLPLYLIHQNKSQLATKRLLETALNTTSQSIGAQEVFASADRMTRLSYDKNNIFKTNALREDNWRMFHIVLKHEIEGLNLSLEKSDYSDYYQLKGEDFSYTPSPNWKPKQWGVYNALSNLKPATVLDIGANTGWFSVLAAKQGAKVVSLDNDPTCMDILYRRAKAENLCILPLITDFLEPTPDVAAMAELDNDPRRLNSRFGTDVPLLLSSDKRIACEMVVALALIHHLCLGMGKSLDQVTRQLALYAKKHLVLEFVTKQDPLILDEPAFFSAQHANPGAFDWYTLEGCISLLGRFFGSIERTPLTETRILLTCTQKREGSAAAHPEACGSEQAADRVPRSGLHANQPETAPRRPRILFTTPLIEHPPAGGPALRIENSIKALNRTSELHLVPRIGQHELGGPAAEEFYRRHSHVFAYTPCLTGSSNPVDEECNAQAVANYAVQQGIDIIWCGYGNVSFRFMKTIKALNPALKVVCDTDSVWSRFVLRELPLETDPLRRLRIEDEGRSKEREEAEWVDFCDATTAVSEVDADYYRELAADPSRIHTFSNAIDLDSYATPPPPASGIRSPSMYLAGSFYAETSPMARSARWILDEVLPKVRQAIPDITLYIIGNGADTMLADIRQPNVVITGKVPSVLPYLCHTDVALVPLMFESGTRFKILEAAACNIPIVSTVLGAEGIPVEQGTHILLADDPDAFASAIVRVLTDAPLAQRLRTNCRLLVEKDNSIDSLVAEANAIFSRLLPA